jgi:hypothetical protein
MKWLIIPVLLLAPFVAVADTASPRSAYVAQCASWGSAFTPKSCACIFDDIAKNLSPDGVAVWVAEITPNLQRIKNRADVVRRRGQGYADTALETAAVSLPPAMGRCRVPLD